MIRGPSQPVAGVAGSQGSVEARSNAALGDLAFTWIGVSTPLVAWDRNGPPIKGPRGGAGG
ncbi:MAG: hypothetical protein AB7J34_25220, partial [Limisphaerales bacterium]